MLIDGFNAACNNVYASYLKVGDESMSAIIIWKTAKGNSPHLSYIVLKPEPPWEELKTFSYSVTGALRLIEFQRGKEGMKHRKYQQELGATVACTKIMMQATKGIGQKYRKGVTKDCFLVDSWFYSKEAAEAVMKVGAKLIGMVKKNTKGFCKDTIEKLTNYWPGGTYLVLRSKTMVPGGRPIIAIGYTYNMRKVLSFIVTDNAGITQAGPPYLSKYPDQFINVAILPVALPLVMSIFFLLLTRLNPKKKQGSLIWRWKSYGLLSVVGYGYVRQLLWE